MHIYFTFTYRITPVQTEVLCSKPIRCWQVYCYIDSPILDFLFIHLSMVISVISCSPLVDRQNIQLDCCLIWQELQHGHYAQTLLPV